MCWATGCPLRQETRTNYFSLSFDGNQTLQGEVNVIIKLQSLLFWQAVLYPTQMGGKILIVQQRDLHASQNRNIHLMSNLNDGIRQKLLFPLPIYMLSEARINCQYILYKNSSPKTHPGKPCPIQRSLGKQTTANISCPWLTLCLCLHWYN